MQWFPAHMRRGLRQMEQRIRDVDIILEVRDARVCATFHHTPIKFIHLEHVPLPVCRICIPVYIVNIIVESKKTRLSSSRSVQPTHTSNRCFNESRVLFSLIKVILLIPGLNKGCNKVP